MTENIDDEMHKLTAEVTPPLKNLLTRIRNGQALVLTENGVVVARLERIEDQKDPFDRDKVRAAFEGLEKLRASLERPLGEQEIEEAISEGRM